jgi:hypothetical protein
MNALELADELEEFSGNGAFKYYLEIATMLRQQQKQLELHKNAHHEAVEICRQQADEITELKLQLAIMEGEYPEPTINEKVKEFKDLAQALAEIEALKDELKLIDELVRGKK